MSSPSPLYALLLLLPVACGGIAVTERDAGTGGASSGSAATTTSASGREPGPCDGGGVCGVSSPGCVGCAVATQCSADFDACAEEPECVAYSDCVAVCAEPGCLEACQSAHPLGVAPHDALVACLYCDACYFDCDGASAGCSPSP